MVYDQSSVSEMLNSMQRVADLDMLQSKFNTESTIPRVITISGGKGGIGKSVTTVNLGVCLSRLGARVLVVDADLGLANIDVILNLDVKQTIDNVLSEQGHICDVIHKGPENIDVLPASSGILKVSELSLIHKNILLNQIEELEGKYDIILIDTPAGISNNVKYWLTASSEIIMVVTPEPTSLSDCYASMKILSHEYPMHNFKLLINMVKTHEEGLKIFERLSTLSEDYLNIKLDFLGILLNDDAVKMSVKIRTPFSVKYPFSKASECMRTVARDLLSLKNYKSHQNISMQFFWRKLIGNSNNKKAS